MSISIHPELEDKLELESLALEGLNSGESVEEDEEYWKEKRRRLIERHSKTDIKMLRASSQERAQQREL